MLDSDSINEKPGPGSVKNSSFSVNNTKKSSMKVERDHAYEIVDKERLEEL